MKQGLFGFGMLLIVVVGMGISAAEAASRLVVIGGDLTEIVYALGAGDKIVAADTTSRYPLQVSSVPKVGYMRSLAAEGVLSTQPDLILASEKAGPLQAVTQLKRSGIAYVEVADAPSLIGFAEKTRVIGAALDQQQAAENVISRMQADLAAARAPLEKPHDKVKALFVLSTGRGAMMGGGANTTADRLITLAGGENVLSGVNEFKTLTAEAILSNPPEVIITMPRVLQALGGKEALLARTEFSATPAAKNRRVLEMDGGYFLGLGVRTPEAVAKLVKLFHPELAGG